MAAVRAVVETRVLFCSLYSDRGSHFFVTPKAGEKVDKTRLTQVGRAMRDLGIQMIPASSPQARGRSERSFGTWQNRLPQELRLAGITTVEGANQFLRDRYIADFNSKFAVAPEQRGTAFRKCARPDLDYVFSIQTERVVAKPVPTASHPPLEISQTAGNSHFSTAPTTTSAASKTKPKARRAAA
ncbi:MAG TPA: hypothetical protein VN428_01475 [Bryobacteraceae bacterium]|nr:hypothetical protein [Bryobacteraceae bacterium]